MVTATASLATRFRGSAQLSTASGTKVGDAARGRVHLGSIVMNDAEMYEYAVDRASGQSRAPLNQIVNEHKVYTCMDTVTIAPNSDTPYSGGF